MSSQAAHSETRPGVGLWWSWSKGVQHVQGGDDDDGNHDDSSSYGDGDGDGDDNDSNGDGDVDAQVFNPYHKVVTMMMMK